MLKQNSIWLWLAFSLLIVVVLPTQRALAADNFDSLYAEIEAANRHGCGRIALSTNIVLSEALPAITGVILIDGAGYTINGGGSYRIFDIDAGGLTINKLTLNAGKAPAGENGGLVRLHNGGSLIANDSSFQNGAAYSGGAIATAGDNVRLAINRSSFTGNAAASRGGALSINGGDVTITNSAFLENTAVTSGGAIEAARGRIEIINSTLDNNEARVNGGAISASGGETVLTHLTISDNLAFDGGDGLSKSGGSLALRNSVITGRSPAEDCAGILDENEGNLIADGTCAPALRGNALLGILIGAPAYRSLEADSRAINAALADYCPATDQIGNARPVGAFCDIGAFESQAGAQPDLPVPPPACGLHDQILAANTDQPAGACPAGSGHDIIILTADVILAADLPPITSPITIEGGGYSISGEEAYRIFNVDGGALTINNLTMKDGSSAHDSGGALRLLHGARVTVNNAVFEGNQAGWGGAIATKSSNVRLAVNNSQFVNNEATSAGAASVTLDQRVIITHAGGAILVDGGVVEVRNSSFQGNRAGFSGGAIETHGGRTSVSNSTFSYNVASSSGGGAIYVGGGDNTLTHLTLRNNRAYIAGGIYQSGGVLRLYNSIVASNSGGDCRAWPVQKAGNLIGDRSCAPASSGDAELGVGAGASVHYPPESGSPALDAGAARFCLPTDQLGNLRPLVGPCDSGAIESVPVVSDLANCRVTTTHKLNFRAGPGGERIGTVPEDTALTASERTPDWFQVEYEGTTGWISADYVVAEGECG